jgi:inosine-uridine nucleoside N-ribohydrolase
MKPLLLARGMIGMIAWISSWDAPVHAHPPCKLPVLLDTDIGTTMDDAFALALVVASNEVELRGVTTVHGDAYTRALVVCRLLHAVGRDEIPVASGLPPQHPADSRSQLRYGVQPSCGKEPLRQRAVDFLYDQFKASPGELTLLAIGPLTNVAELLCLHPECKPWIRRIVLMGGAIHVGYSGKPPVEVEWNIGTDIRAAQIVFASGIPLLVAPLDATTNLKLEERLRQRLFGAGTPLTQQLCALYQLGNETTPALFDPVAAALCFAEQFCEMENLRLEVNDQGFTRVVPGKSNARVATTIRRADFLTWFLDRLAPSLARSSLRPRRCSLRE